MGMTPCARCGQALQPHSIQSPWGWLHPHCAAAIPPQPGWHPPPMPRPAGGNTALIVVAVFGALFLAMFAIVGASGKGGGSAPQETARPATVSVEGLYAAYHANEVDADNRYKGKRLLVTGVVQSIDKTAFNDIQVSFETPNRFMPVRATARDSEAGKVGALSKGQTVTVVCTGSGMIIGNPTLKDCTIQ